MISSKANHLSKNSSNFPTQIRQFTLIDTCCDEMHNFLIRGNTPFLRTAYSMWVAIKGNTAKHSSSISLTLHSSDRLHNASRSFLITCGVLILTNNSMFCMKISRICIGCSIFMIGNKCDWISFKYSVCDGQFWTINIIFGKTKGIIVALTNSRTKHGKICFRFIRSGNFSKICGKPLKNFDF